MYTRAFVCGVCLQFPPQLFHPRYPFTEDQVVQVADWEMYIDAISTMIIEEQSPKRLLEVRGKFYELLTHCIPAEIILKVCVGVCL